MRPPPVVSPSPPSEAAELPLGGGNQSTVVKVGGTVRRTAGAWTPQVHRLLGHLRQQGVQEVPRVIGMDEAGREVLSHLPGTVGHVPLPETLRDDTVLEQAARLLRRLHDATASVAPTWREGWQAPLREPVEVVCHGDFAPYNCVFQDDRLTGVIDFDHAHPGPRAWDLAYAAYRFAPLMAPGNPEHRGTVTEQARRLHCFLAAYGPFDPTGFVDILAARVQVMADHLLTGAARGDERLKRLVERGDAALYEADRAHIEAHRGAFEAALPNGAQVRRQLTD